MLHCTGRGRGGSDGGFYHRSYSYDEQNSGGSGDHYSRTPTDGSSNRGGFEYGRGRGGGGARPGWSNNWRDNVHLTEEERWNSSNTNRWPLSSPSMNYLYCVDMYVPWVVSLHQVPIIQEDLTVDGEAEMSPRKTAFCQSGHNRATQMENLHKRFVRFS